MSLTSVRGTLGGANFNLGVDFTGILGVTVGVIAGQYVAVHLNIGNSDYGGALIATALGIVLVVLFPQEGLMNGIGLGMAGYGLYKVVNIASSGAV